MKTTLLLIIGFIQGMTALNLSAQALVRFNNRFGGRVAHVWGTTGNVSIHGNSTNDSPSGSTIYPGMTLIGAADSPFGASTTFAALLGAPGIVTNDSTMQQGLLGFGIAATTFRTGTAAGIIAQRTATFNNIPGDAPVATFEMVAWDNRSGLYSTWVMASPAWNAGLIAAGKSDLFSFSVPLGGDIFTPPTWADITPGQSTTFNIYYIPEPSTIALLGLGVVATAFISVVAPRRIRFVPRTVG